MSEHFNNLTPAEAERIALLMEEASEVIQCCGKILRHGFESYHPETGEQNRDLLSKELGDFQAALKLLIDNEDVRSGHINVYQAQKAFRVNKYLHHNIAKPECNQ